VTPFRIQEYPRLQTSHHDGNVKIFFVKSYHFYLILWTLGIDLDVKNNENYDIRGEELILS
jgi:hypothetical protein